MKVIKISYSGVAPGKPSKLPPRLKPVEVMTLDECKVEAKRLAKQFVVVHDLPKVGEDQPSAYMHETLDLMRGRTIALHNRTCQLLAEANQLRLKQKKDTKS